MTTGSRKDAIRPMSSTLPSSQSKGLLKQRSREGEKQRSKAADDIYSQAVSSVREPIEALFSWLNEKTNIQRASKCRSTCGLLIHTMGKVAIAFLYLIFNY